MFKIMLAELAKIQQWKFVGFEEIDGITFPVFKNEDGNNIILGRKKCGEHWFKLEKFCSARENNSSYFIVHEE